VARVRAAEREPPPAGLVGTIAFGTLFVLVAGGIGLAQLVQHVPLPGGASHASTAPYRAWIGVLGGVGGALLAAFAIWRRPERADALRLPLVGLVALGLFSLALLGGARWLEYAAGALFVITGAAAWLRTRL
jgi:hypothetical protein